MAMMFLSRKRNKKSRFKLFSGNPTSASWGTLIPTNVTRVIAGDDFSFQPGVGVQALPIVAPFMGSVCVKKEYFFIPDRIYNVDRQLNFQGVTDTPNTVRVIIDQDREPLFATSHHICSKGVLLRFRQSAKPMRDIQTTM